MNRALDFSGHLDKLSDFDNETINAYSGLLNKSGYVLLDAIENIVSLSKIKAKQLKLVYSECKLNDILDELYEICKAEYNVVGKKDLDIIVEKEFDDPDFAIYSDGKRIRQALYYVVNHAIRYTSEGIIKFGYYVEIPNIVFYVEQLGMNLCDSEWDKMLYCFEQSVQRANIEFGDGGLFLCFSKGIVESLDGKIWIEVKNHLQLNEIKESVFYITIPYQGVSRNIVRAYKKVDYKEFSWPGKTILIVEDATISYELLTKFLKDSNVKFLHARDGMQAVELCKKNKGLDLVLMDIQLPIMNGLEATGLIKGFRQELPIIAQTANAMDDDKSTILAAGCDDYISKPINRLELLQKINLFLGSV